MATVLLDDHLLRDWLVGPDRALSRVVNRATIATTNLWYARLCKSAASQRGGALAGSWPQPERDLLAAHLLALPRGVTVVPMVDLAWRMGQLVANHSGLSTLGAEAVAAAESLEAKVVVSERDDSPGIRAACTALGLRYRPLAR